MLEIIRYSSLSEKNKFLHQLDFTQSILIIPDLPSKLYWQEYHLKKTGRKTIEKVGKEVGEKTNEKTDEKIGLTLESQVLRAEDFWKLLLQKNHPEVQIVSRAWVSAYLKQILTPDLLISVGLPNAKVNTVLKALTEFLPILAHPESQEIMQHWFDEVHAGQCSWKKWFDLAAIVWELMVGENLKSESVAFKQRYILSEWATSFLIQSPNFKMSGPYHLVIDLGPELRAIEVELLQSLAAENTIQVLSPRPQWIEEFRWIAYPYEQFTSRSYKLESLSKLELLSKVTKSESSYFFKRFASVVGEIKFAISQIREWLNSGYGLSEIAVMAPDIEEYWPMLSVHLTKECLVFEKSEKSTLGSFGSVVAWLAYLKKQKYSTLSFEELQLAEFHPLNRERHHKISKISDGGDSLQLEGEDIAPEISYESLQTLWSRRPYPNLFSQEPQSQCPAEESQCHADEFMAWALRVWPQSILISTDVLESCHKWVEEVRSLGLLSEREWIECLEEYLNAQEKEVSAGTAHSIGVYSLMNGIPAHKSLHIFLGCSEAQLKSHRGLVSGSEVLSLQHHTGHLLAHPDRDFREFQLRSLLGEGREQYFTFPETNLSGENLVPSVFWMKGREEEINKNNLPLSSTYFHQQASWKPGHWEQELLEQILTKGTQASSEFFLKLPHSTKANEETNGEKVSHSIPFSLSPASLKTYVECPFKFFAEKGLKLNVPVVVDLDLDPRTQGSLQHKLLELLTTEPFDPVAKRVQVKDIIEQTLESQKDHYYSEATKELMRQQLQRLATNFLQHEEVYRKEFPRFYTLAREAWFQRSVEVENKKVKFRGKIDRIDLSLEGNEAIVIDYKNDIKSYSHAPSWMKNLEFQMPAYVQAVESGATKTETGENIAATPVVAAHYYSLRDFSRKGFTLDEVSAGVVAPLSATGTLSTHEKTQMIQDFQKILTDSAKKILEGDFNAIPHPQTDCKNCSWRNLCRTRQPNL